VVDVVVTAAAAMLANVTEFTGVTGGVVKLIVGVPIWYKTKLWLLYSLYRLMV
jgi:hypothetical protein